MNIGASGMALAALLIGSQGLAAQQPGHAPRDSAARTAMMKEMQQHMRMMDSASARLDTLVQRMNRATGNAKVTAMAQVINELVAQRRAMQAHMQQMMQSHRETMRSRMGTEPAAQAPGTDTSEHAEHR